MPDISDIGLNTSSSSLLTHVKNDQQIFGIQAREVSQSDQILADVNLAQGSILSIDLIRSDVEAALTENLRDMTATIQTLLEDTEFIKILQKIIKKKDDVGALGHLLRDIRNRFIDQKNSDEDKNIYLESLSKFINEVKDIYAQMMDIEEASQEKLKNAILSLSLIFTKISNLNNIISEKNASGDDKTEDVSLIHQTIDALSEEIDFSCIYKNDGSVNLYTKKGTALAGLNTCKIDSSEKIIVSADNLSIQESLTTAFTRGRMVSLIKTSEITIPALKKQLDLLAQIFQSRINLMSNRIVSQSGGQQKFKNTRSFKHYDHNRIGFLNGDVVIQLWRQDYSLVAQASLASELRYFRHVHNLPYQDYFPLSIVAKAINLWLNEILKLKNYQFAYFTEQHSLEIEFPDTLPYRLSFKDQRATTLRSSLIAPINQPLGLMGKLILSDGLNRIALEGQSPSIRLICPEDNLITISDRLNNLGLVSSQLIEVGDNFLLEITSALKRDLFVIMDHDNYALSRSLGLLPSPHLPEEDVSICHIFQKSSQVFQSRSFTNVTHERVEGGLFQLIDDEGQIVVSTVIEPDSTIEFVSQKISQDLQKIDTTVSLVPSGNMTLLKITNPDGKSFRTPFRSDSLISRPIRSFKSQKSEIIFIRNQNTICQITIEPDLSLFELYTVIKIFFEDNPDYHIFTAWHDWKGLQSIELYSDRVDNFSLSGSLLGKRENLLDFTYNMSDQLGLMSPAYSLIPGFSNFFGLNDLITLDSDLIPHVINSPGLFSSNAMPDLARSIHLSSKFNAEDNDRVYQEICKKFPEILTEPVNIAEAGLISRCSKNMIDYCDLISDWVYDSFENKQYQINFDRALKEQLGHQKNKFQNFTILNQIEELAIYQASQLDYKKLLLDIPKLLSTLTGAYI